MMIAVLLTLAPAPQEGVWDRLKFDAEGRMRGEATFNNVDAGPGAGTGMGVDDRFRGRMRFRVGAKYDLAENFQLIARMSTASDGNDANNPHWDFGDGDGFSGGGLVFDRYFIDYMPSSEFHARFGKQPHAFMVTPVFGDYVWDSDVSPSGLTAFWTPDIGGDVKLDTRFAGYVATESSSEQDPKMLGTQVNVTLPIGGPSLTVSNALYAWMDNHVVSVPGNQGNSSTTEDFTTYEGILAARFPCDSVDEVTGYLQLLSNLRENDQGFTTGVQVGADKWKKGNWNAFASFYTLDGDVIFSPVAQDDTAIAGTGLNNGLGGGMSGFIFGGRFWMKDNISLKLWALTSNASGAEDDPIRIRLDLDFKVL